MLFWCTQFISLHFDGKTIEIEVSGGRRAVLEPCHLRNQIRFVADNTAHAKPLLPLADEE